jgi:hypothetical protein
MFMAFTFERCWHGRSVLPLIGRAHLSGRMDPRKGNDESVVIFRHRYYSVQIIGLVCV